MSDTIESLRAELDAAVEIYARNADGYLAMEAAVKTLTELLAAEKEARQNAENERDRLLAIEREARALMDVDDVEPIKHHHADKLRRALGMK